MTTATRRPPITSGIIFRWRSLKTRVTLFTLSFFLVGIWSLALYSSYTLQSDMKQALGEQQFSTITIIASDINNQLDDRLRTLEMIAAKITPTMLGNAASTQIFLESEISLKRLFNYGAVVTRLDNIAIAEVPIAGRIGINYGDRDWIIEALKGKKIVGKPVLGKNSNAPAFMMVVPIRDTKGKVIGVLTGATDLNKPNFISNIADYRYGKTGGYLLVSPQLRTIVYSTDKKRIMEVLPAPGINPLLDRYIQGYEGSGVLVDQVGVEMLASVKSIPVAGWYVAALMPTEEAFAPIRTMQQRMLLVAIFLTLLVGGLIWWILKRQLAPIFKTIRTLATLSDTSRLLPVTRHDEIGELIGGFNSLLETLGKREEALKENEELFRSYLEYAPDGVYMNDLEGNFLYCNRKCEEIIGYRREELIGKNLLEFSILPENSLNKAIRLLQANIEGKSTGPDEIDLISKEGRRIPVEITTNVVRRKGQRIVLSFVRDITDRTRAEQALRESEEKHRLLIENSHDIIYTHTKEGVFTFVSPAWTVLLGRPVTEVVGKFFQPLVHPDDLAGCIVWLQKMIETGQRQRGIEYRLQHADGTWRWYTSSAVPIKDESGMVTGLYGTAHDITDRKQAEEEKKLLEERLQRAEKMEALGTLAGGVAHDLNNVLGIVVGYAEMILDEIDESNPLRSDVLKIMEGGHRSAAIVQDLLTLARRGVQTRQVVRLNAVVMDCQKTPEFDKILSFNPRVRIKTDLDADLLNMTGSTVHLCKTIMNLVSNAVEAMPDGGNLTIRTSNQYMGRPIQGYDAVRDGDYVVLTVSDTGEGIPEKDIKRIFEPFYTKKVMGRSGTGLGLAVVWGTVKDHNGYIDVQSKEGKGTTFTICFPVTREEADRDQISAPISEYMGRGETILVVDDVTGQRELAARMLTKLSYEVTTVESGEEAIEHLKTNNAELIVLDMIMDPGIDGLETYKKILEINPAQKAIIVSGFSESERVQEAQELGAGPYVKKPYVLERLGIAVRNELDEKSKTALVQAFAKA